MDIITEFIKILELKRYSKQTINSYKGHLLLTKSHFNNKPFKSISDQELFDFIYDFFDSEFQSQNYQIFDFKSNNHSRQLCVLVYDLTVLNFNLPFYLLI